MRTVLKARKITHGALLAIAIAATFAPSALGVKANVPRVSTGGVKHVHGTTGQLDAVVNPDGIETSCFFEYGPTVAYGKSTKPEAVGKGTKGLKIGQPVTGILAGYHYRAVATYVDAKGAERENGKDKSASASPRAKKKPKNRRSPTAARAN